MLRLSFPKNECNGAALNLSAASGGFDCMRVKNVVQARSDSQFLENRRYRKLTPATPVLGGGLAI
jgi:hypothetical protein